MIFKKFSKRIFICIGLLIAVFSLLFVGNQPVERVQAEVPPGENCVLTPELLGGQGFTVSGLGFTVSGLGFTVSGLGFTVSGLGFTVSGLGIDPVTVAQEIKDNTITNAWLTNLQPDIAGGPDFNTVKTAVLIVDDFNTPTSHGNQVLAVFNHLASAVDMSHILLVPINVGGPDGSYRTSAIESAIRQAIEGPSTTYGPGGLLGQGYEHFVINMSFGIVPCDDEGMVIGETPVPPFNFDAGLQAIEDAQTPPPPQPIYPILECVKKVTSHHSGGGHRGLRTGSSSQYYAYFGYDNQNDNSVLIPVGNNNKFHSGSQDQGQTRLFESGRQEDVFSVKFDGSNLTWKVKGPDGILRSVTANRYSTPCGSVPSAPYLSITPVLECVATNGPGSYRAYFGYTNANAAAATIDVGGHNKFTPGPVDKGQPNIFLPGSRTNVFSVVFNGSSLKWEIKGPDNVRRSVTATSSSKPCVQENGFGMIDYLEQQGVPPELIDDYFQQLAGNASDEDELSGLRGLLQGYLAQSASSGGSFAVIPIASSGNYRPWLGAAPLAPARWPEVIAVGATVGNNGPIWQFAHDANAIAPGVGFKDGTNSSIAGTSFAAPFVSMAAAQWLTYPSACIFDGVNPPVVTASMPKTSNTPFVAGVSSPLNCAKPVEAEVEVCYATTVIEYKPAKRKNGSAIPSHRRNPELALGAPQNDNTLNYVTLGFGTSDKGVLILDFAPNIILNLDGFDVRVWESSFDGNSEHSWHHYPEKVKVYASQDGDHWVQIGVTSNNDQAYDLGSLEWARYIKVHDVSDKNSSKFYSTDDGFDVDAIEGTACIEDTPYETESLAATSQVGATSLVQSTDTSVQSTGRWTVVRSERASGGSYLYNNGTRREALTLVFRGTSVEVVYGTNSEFGMFTIVIDDTAIRTVTATDDRTRFGVRTRITGLTPGIHTLRIEPIRGTVAIDAFYIQ